MRLKMEGGARGRRPRSGSVDMRDGTGSYIPINQIFAFDRAGWAIY